MDISPLVVLFQNSISQAPLRADYHGFITSLLHRRGVFTNQACATIVVNLWKILSMSAHLL